VAEVSVHEAKTHLSALLARVEAGEEMVITRGGRPVARLVALERSARRLFGLDAGLFEVPDDFDAPLPDDMLAAFER
jgi:prevent-host-death family protein